MSKCSLPVASALFALMLAGCGGGGGGGSDSAPATTVAITSANSKALAADGLQNATGEQLAEAGGSLVTGVQVDNAAQASAPQLAAAARKLLSLVPAQAPLATGVAVSETVACSGGGTLTISGNLSGGSAMVAGDSLTLSASNCKETVDGWLQTMSGSMTVSITAGSITAGSIVSASSYPYHIVMSITAANFSISGAGVTETSDGDLQMDVAADSATSEVSVLSGISLSSSTTTPGGTRRGALKNYRQAISLQGTTVTTDVKATIESTNTRLGTGVVKYDLTTPIPLVADTTTGAYTSGSMKIVGANSALLVTVTGTNTFLVQVDSNGDGSYEASSTATLSELQALL